MLTVYLQFYGPQPIKTPSPPHQTAPTIPSPQLHHQHQADTTAHPSSQTYLQGARHTTAQKAKEIVLENEVMKVTLTSQGGMVKEVTLKKYKTYDQRPLVLLDAQSSAMEWQFNHQQHTLHTHNLFFETNDASKHIAAHDTAQVTFTLGLGPNAYMQQRFFMTSNSYTLGYQVQWVGLEPPLDNKTAQFVWHDLAKRVEKNVEESQHKTTINYYLANGTFDNLSEQAEKKEQKTLEDPIQWVGVKQKFFTKAIIANKAFQRGDIATFPILHDTAHVKSAVMNLAISLDNPQQENAGFILYFGPNHYEILKNVAKSFSNNVYLGWPVVKWINQFLIIPIFNFLEQYIGNYGIIIILLVLIVKIILLPLSYKSYVAMAKMKLVKPALDALKAKHGGDARKMQMEQMGLYREMGINPMSGCVPVLLQIPILFAMFNFFPSSIELRQQSFLWADDLSTYDSIATLPFSIPFYGSHVSLFTILMTASTILYTWSNNQLSAAQGPMKTMSYIMPITFMFVLNTFPAGLSFYYFISNLVTFAQQALIKKFVDEEKIKQQLEENKKQQKNKHKSKFQARLEQAMKASESYKKR